MAKYIFTERNGIYIIDLQKTVRKAEEAYMFIRDVAAQGGSVLFVGTKKQARESIEQEAKRCNMFYVNNRWLGGMLTDEFKTIRQSIARLTRINNMEKNGDFEALTKKEVSKLVLEREKLEEKLGRYQRDASGCRALCLSLIPAKSILRFPKHASSGSRSSAFAIPTVIRMNWIM